MLLVSDFAVRFVEQRLNVGDVVLGTDHSAKTKCHQSDPPHSKFYLCLKIKTNQSLIEKKVKDL